MLSNQQNMEKSINKRERIHPAPEQSGITQRACQLRQARHPLAYRSKAVESFLCDSLPAAIVNESYSVLQSISLNAKIRLYETEVCPWITDFISPSI